ncbi:MAG: hypothetical protein QXJ18_01680 [Desulfurococcaceae archaeon]
MYAVVVSGARNSKISVGRIKKSIEVVMKSLVTVVFLLLIYC